MTVSARIPRSFPRRAVALIAVVPVYLLARLPEVSAVEKSTMSARFSFERCEIPIVSTRTPRTARPVSPSVEHLSGWINTLGAGIALCDLDQNGLDDDIVSSDPRTDDVSVLPAPSSNARFAPFVLDPSALRYDRATMAPMGAVPCDVNEDGQLDILVFYWGRSPIAFLRRESSPLAPQAFAAREVFPGAERWYTNGLSCGDLDGDGHVDLVVGNYFPDGSRLLDANSRDPETMQDSMTRALNGGRNRLLRWVSSSAGPEPTVAFEDQSDCLAAGLLHGWTLAIGLADIDFDLAPEIYFANDFGNDQLLHNRSTPGRFAFSPLVGVKTFGMPTSKVLGRDSYKGMGVDFGDVDGDGLLDIYVSNITTEFGLQESQFLFVNTGEFARMRDGVAPYVDESEPLGLSRSGWAWDAKLVDYDDDGVLEAQQALGFMQGHVNRWPELHEIAMANDQMLRGPSHWHRFVPGDELSGHDPSPFFVRGESGRFHDLSRAIGIDRHEVRRGIAVADIDGDGDQDFAAANQWQSSAVYLNRSTARGASLDLALVLRCDQKREDVTVVVAGAPDPAIRARAAIGATVKVRRAKTTADADDHRARTLFVDGGNGHSGVRSHSVHIGLGRVAADEKTAFEVLWRDAYGRSHTMTLALPPGRHTIYLGAQEQGP